MHDLLIVILNYNTRALLHDCLASLNDQEGVDFITCVVDNASTDDSAALVREEFPEVDLIPSKTNDGYPAGNNLGLRAHGFPSMGEARYAMLLNPDTVVPPGALRAMVDYADQHTDIGILGPKLVLPDGTLDKACRRGFPTPAVSLYQLTGLSKVFAKSPRFGRYNMTFLDENSPADVDAVVGACMMLRRELISAIGLLDERFFMYGEDIDWCLRAKQCRVSGQTNPYRVFYLPSVTIHHVKRAASRHSSRAKYEFTRAMWLFYSKHYRATSNSFVDWCVRTGLSFRGGAALSKEIRSA